MKNNTKKITTIVVAGKLAASAGLASAAGLGKTDALPDDGVVAHPLSLDQIGYPLEILTPPIDATEATGNDGGGKLTSQESGVIYATDTGKAFNSNLQPRIDFIINNIRNRDNPVVVFLAYSTVKGEPVFWEQFGINNFLLDTPAGSGQGSETLKIFSAFQLDPLAEADLSDIFESVEKITPLGRIDDAEGKSIIVSLKLSDLQDPSLSEGNLYFQVLAVPLINDEFAFDQAQTSELDHYRISREDPNVNGSGSKTGDTGGKYQENVNNGSKTDSKAGTPSDTDNGSKGVTTTPDDTGTPDNGSKGGTTTPDDAGTPDNGSKGGTTTPDDAGTPDNGSKNTDSSTQPTGTGTNTNDTGGK